MEPQNTSGPGRPYITNLNDAFQEIRPWAVESAENQDQPRAYRQPKYLPHLVNDAVELDRFERLIYRKDPNTGELDPTFLWPRLISRALNRVDYLEMVGDSRNALLPDNRRPVPERLWNNSITQVMMHRHVGNLLDDMFAEYQYEIVPEMKYLAWPNDSIAMDDTQYMIFVNHMDAISRLEFIQRQRLRQNTGGLFTPFHWVHAFRRSLEDARNSVFAAWKWSRQEHGTIEDALRICLQDIPEMTRLMIILIDRELSFEYLQAQEHIFGCQFDKRIQLLSSTDLSKLWSGFVSNGDGDKFDLTLAIYDTLPGLYRQLTDQALRLNQLFDYKYLWAWSAIKMWDRLYVIVRPDMDISVDTMTKFRLWTRGRNNSQVLRDAFAVYPITEERMRGESCPICLDEFVDNHHPVGVMVLKTKCGHWFHPKCLIDHWDQPYFWWNRCPSCREPALRLRDLQIFTPRQEDLEHETGDNHQMEGYRHDQVADWMANQRDPTELEKDALDAYWRRRIREDILKPMHDQRAAGRETWASVLGGP